VLWGDYKPSGQPVTQLDQLIGGPGKDFIYAGHGRNVIVTGAGPDVVHAHFGRGEIPLRAGRHGVPQPPQPPPVQARRLPVDQLQDPRLLKGQRVAV
jgi:hypothetical protein